MPIYVAREWFRHGIGFARNEVSRRYVDTLPECYNPTNIRERDQNVKQGSKCTNIAENELVSQTIETLQNDIISVYTKLLELKVAPELARGILPQSMYTEFIETGSLSAYARLCNLRLDPHAQYEIQQYAKAVSDLIETKFPVSWANLTK
jgi:thymidylate synthase (FAD)